MQGRAIHYEKQFKALADRLAREPISEPALERRVLRHRWVIDDDIGPRARANREPAIEQVLRIFRGRGAAGDTTGNSPRSKCTAFSAGRDALALCLARWLALPVISPVRSASAGAVLVAVRRDARLGYDHRPAAARAGNRRVGSRYRAHSKPRTNLPLGSCLGERRLNG